MPIEKASSLLSSTSITTTTNNNNNNNNNNNTTPTTTTTTTTSSNNNNNTQQQIAIMRRRKGLQTDTSSISPLPTNPDNNNNNNNDDSNNVKNQQLQQQQQHEQQQEEIVGRKRIMFPTLKTISIVGITILVITIQFYVGIVQRHQQQQQQEDNNQYNNNNNNIDQHRQLVLNNNNNNNMDVITSLSTSSEQEKLPKQKQKKINHKQCRIYLAPSSVKGLQGYGIFTTEDMDAGEILLSKPDGPSIPVVDYIFEPSYTGTFGSLSRQAWIRVWDNYWWGRGVSDIVLSESQAGQVIDYQIMFGSLPNHHCILHVLDHTWSNDNSTTSPYYDDTMDLPNASPGTGAYSYYAGRNFFVKRSMKAGDEIFLNYGHCHDEIERMPSWAATIPKRYDFQTASRIVQRLHRYIQQEIKYNPNLITSNDEWYSELLDKAIKSVRARITEQILQLLPDSYETYELVVKHITDDIWIPTNNNDLRIRNNEMISRVLAKYIGTHIRDVNWIKNNGICLENIIPQRSTIPYAGRGAFAQFPIKAGDVIVPVPMLQIPNKDSMNLYDDDGTIYTKQLLLNYCFGHKESSLLVCPNTNAILINHCSVRTKECGPRGPNAKYRWATTWDKDTANWLQMSIDEIIQQEGRGISMEIIATRYIQPGEEIFIDYGEEWEKDWEQHKVGWFDKPSSKVERPSVLELNKKDGALTELVSGNLRKFVDDEHLQTQCVFWTDNDDYDKVFTRPSPDWMTWDDETILDKFACDGEMYVQDYTVHAERTYWPCSVLLPEDPYGEYYTVRIHPSRFAPDLPWVKNKVPRIITGYPRASIRYFYKSYKTDMHLDGVFRRHIDIENSIFPEAWKNRKVVDDINTML